MRQQQVDLGYRARSQFVPFHQRRQRWAVLTCHRRAGKTVACVMDLVDAALRCTKVEGRFAYMAPTYSQAKDTAWAYLKRFTAPIPGVNQRESDLTVFMPNGARVRLYGSDNYDRLRGGYADGVVLDEYQDFDPRAYPEVIRPALADRGGWAVFVGTPKGNNDFKRVHDEAKNREDWLSLTLRASETGILPAAELEDMRRDMTQAQYDQELECSFEAAVIGAIYRTELDQARADGRICGVPYDPAAPVWVSWDLGIGDSTALWCAQVVGREIHLIDYYEDSGADFTSYLAWLDSKPYRYATDLFPHDAGARELGTGRSIQELAVANGRKVRIVPKLSVEDGINALKLMLPRMWIDAEKCARGLECLTYYRRDWNDKMGVFKPAPVHDWSSHGADSARYLAVGLKEAQAPVVRLPSKPTPRPMQRPGASASWMGR